MRREGRQHGMVLTHVILPPPFSPANRTKRFNSFDSPPTAGYMTRVPSKPTNHSKFTSRCGRPRCRGCHTHPVSKAQGKAKGQHKLRSHDTTLDHRMLLRQTGDDEYENDNEIEPVDFVNEEEEKTSNTAVEVKGGKGEGDGEMSFCEIGFVVQCMDGEDWCVVREM